jgi:hypothetical protein
MFSLQNSVIDVIYDITTNDDNKGNDNGVKVLFFFMIPKHTYFKINVILNSLTQNLKYLYYT